MTDNFETETLYQYAIRAANNMRDLINQKERIIAEQAESINGLNAHIRTLENKLIQYQTNDSDFNLVVDRILEHIEKQKLLKSK